MATVKSFLRHHYRHFNAASVVDAADGWQTLLDRNGKMLLTLGGAMSTAELGLSLAELIRRDKVHAISCTGANLEEDLFNLVAHDHYRRIPLYRSLTAKDEQDLHDRGLNRVTDTCIPEDEAFEKLRQHVSLVWQEASDKNERLFPYEMFYRIIRSGRLEASYQIDPKDSWMIAACEKDIPIWTPGWEDSTLGNYFVACTFQGKIRSPLLVKSGIEQMHSLINWYRDTVAKAPIGFFQIAGGISGDFPICVVPLIRKDLEEDCALWAYFAQISDSTTSYGSYSGAVPNEKITWGKLDESTPKFVIESDATIVFPLIAQYLLDEGER
jgi:deoxyhypusine synthase